MALASSEATNPHWGPRKKIGDLGQIPKANRPRIIGTTSRLLRGSPAYGAHMVKPMKSYSAPTPLAVPPSRSLVPVLYALIEFTNADLLFCKIKADLAVHQYQQH